MYTFSRKEVAALALVILLVILLFPLSQSFASGYLKLKSDPPGIDWEIKIDGKKIDFSQEFEMGLEEGSYSLHAKASGYQAIDKRFSIKKGRVKIINLKAVPSSIIDTTETETVHSEQKMSSLVVVSDPRDVAFTIDGRKGRTPASFLIGVGRHKIESEKYSRSFDVVENQTTYIKLDMKNHGIYSFSMTKDQEAKISASSQEELFEKGFKLYGKGSGGSMIRTTPIVALVVFGIVLFFFAKGFLRKKSTPKRTKNKRKAKAKNKNKPKDMNDPEVFFR